MPGSGFCCVVERVSHTFVVGPSAAAVPAPAAPPAPQAPREAGVKKAEGSYRPSSVGSPLDLWHGENCEHAKPSPYAKLYWFGSVVWEVDDQTKEKCYFGHGDHFFFSSGEQFKQGLCLGFSHKPGHAYGVLASIDDTTGVKLVEVEAFRGFAKEPFEPDTARAGLIVSQHLQPVEEKPRMWFSRISASLFLTRQSFSGKAPALEAIPKELQSFNSPGLKPDAAQPGTARARRQTEVFGVDDNEKTPNTTTKRGKEGKKKKKAVKKKKPKVEDESGTPQAAMQPPAPAGAMPSAAVDFLRLFQQGGVAPQGLFPTAPAQVPHGQQFVFNNFNVYVIPDPKK